MTYPRFELQEHGGPAGRLSVQVLDLHDGARVHLPVGGALKRLQHGHAQAVVGHGESHGAVGQCQRAQRVCHIGQGAFVVKAESLAGNLVKKMVSCLICCTLFGLLLLPSHC